MEVMCTKIRFAGPCYRAPTLRNFHIPNFPQSAHHVKSGRLELGDGRCHPALRWQSSCYRYRRALHLRCAGASPRRLLPQRRLATLKQLSPFGTERSWQDRIRDAGMEPEIIPAK